MNFRHVARHLGLIMILLSLTMLFALSWAILEGDSQSIQALGLSVGTGLMLGLSLVVIGHQEEGALGRREALLMVSLSWILGAGLSALPFWYWAQGHTFQPGDDTAFLSFASAYFEAMSGLTTTGASVLSNIHSLPNAILLWRSFTHWLGGLGIVVLFVAVLPLLGVGTKRVFQMEAPGPSKEGVTSRIAETARVLWIIYLVFTGVLILLLRTLGDMNWLDAICHSFGTVSTGGFSTRNESAGAYGAWAQWILIVFMIFSGINFNLYYHIVFRRSWRMLKDPELILYLSLILLATGIIAFSCYRQTYNLTDGTLVVGTGERLVRDTLFQVSSIMTTTGFASVNFDQWAHFSKAVLIFLMFVGGCGGSTAGGIKVSRILITLKVLWTELEKSFRPNVVRTIRVGKFTVDESLRLQVISYVLAIILIFVFGTGFLILFEPSDRLTEISAMSAVVATLNNVGPGFEAVGALGNYGWMSAASKWVLSLLMVVGRLEIFAILVLFMPRYWKST